MIIPITHLNYNMSDSFSKQEREKKKRRKKQEKLDKLEQKKQKSSEDKGEIEFVYIDENGNFTNTPPDLSKKTEIALEDIDISIPKASELEEEGEGREGLVKFYNSAKQFGFIIDRKTKKEFFVHGDNLIDDIQEKDKVSFEIGMGQKGEVAINVKLFGKEEE